MASATNYMNDMCKHIVGDIELNEDYDFEDVVDHILASTGNIPVKAECKLYNLKAKDLAHRHAAEATELVDRLTSRLTSGTKDKQEALTRFKTARIHSLQSAEGKHFLENRNIRTDDNLRPVKHIMCYSCGKEGNKYSCPDKSSSKKPDSNRNKQPKGKDVPFILDLAALNSGTRRIVSLKSSGCGEITL